MNTATPLYRKTVRKTFKVSPEKINEQRVLSICSMLSAVTAINDEVIVTLLGSLDFGQISIDHFSLDVVSDALLNDVIILDAGIEIVSENRIRVRLEGLKQSSNTLILRGSFGFSVREARLLQYSLS